MVEYFNIFYELLKSYQFLYLLIFETMTFFENLTISQKVNAALHRDVFNICTETTHSLGLEITRAATAIIAELVFRKISLYGLDLEAFAKHAKRTIISQEDVKLLARRNNSLKEHLNGLCKKVPSASKEKRRKTTLPITRPETAKGELNDESQAKRQKFTIDDEFNLPGPSKPAENIVGFEDLT